MLHLPVLISLCIFLVVGVFGVEADEIKVSAMEGGSFTLRTGLTEIQSGDGIEWRFGSSKTRIAGIPEGNNGADERFKGRLQLEGKTGDLTITDVSREHSGDYQLSIIIRNTKSFKLFTATVYASLPIPMIFTDTSQCSSTSGSSSRMFLCSVVNVSHVILSWYKGNSLLSNTSTSDLSISLSLPLEVEYQDTNTYSCMINNPISHHTTHLDISQLCQTCSDCDLCFDSAEAVIRLVISAVMGVAAVAAVVLLVYDIKGGGRAQAIK